MSVEFESSFGTRGFKFYGDYSRPYTIPLIEKSIRTISYNIRCKEGWWLKYKDPQIASKWKAEIREELQKQKSVNIDDIIDYVFDELAYFDNVQLKSNYTFHLGYNDHVFYTDNLIPQLVKESFLLNASNLEKNEPVDYHPNSNNQVIDLVHPSLFPLVYGRSVCDKGIVKQPFTAASMVASKFQWLPSLFQFDKVSKSYKIDSYINNLHPIKYQSLYKDIEDIFNYIVPGFELSLSRSLGKATETGIEMPFASKDVIYDEYLTKKINPDQYNDENEDEVWDKCIAIEEAEGQEHLKPFAHFKFAGPPEIIPLKLSETFPQLKVIVKMANIVLTPESPEYPGGSWHVEGSDHERIIASAIYYYESENIDDSRLQFCEPMMELEEYGQDEECAVRLLFGLEREDSLVSDQGDVLTQKDRIVIFPNFLHHKVKPFRLKDSSKPAIRKILCFFLIDPVESNGHVYSTKDIVPQQKSWWDENEESLVSNEQKENVLKFATDKTIPITLEEAQVIRQELMTERSSSIKDALEHNYTFSLCEH